MASGGTKTSGGTKKPTVGAPPPFKPGKGGRKPKGR